MVLICDFARHERDLGIDVIRTQRCGRTMVSIERRGLSNLDHYYR
jgi:hypothetical protein